MDKNIGFQLYVMKMVSTVESHIYDSYILGHVYVRILPVATHQISPVNSSLPNKMATISQMTFSNEFSWMKMFEFWLQFH